MSQNLNKFPVSQPHFLLLLSVRSSDSEPRESSMFPKADLSHLPPWSIFPMVAPSAVFHLTIHPIHFTWSINLLKILICYIEPFHVRRYYRIFLFIYLFILHFSNFISLGSRRNRGICGHFLFISAQWQSVSDDALLWSQLSFTKILRLKP